LSPKKNPLIKKTLLFLPALSNVRPTYQQTSTTLPPSLVFHQDRVINSKLAIPSLWKDGSTVEGAFIHDGGGSYEGRHP